MNTVANQSSTLEQANDTTDRSNHHNTLNDLKFTLINHLQSSLELESMLDTFFQHIQSLLRCSGLHYQHSHKALSLSFGQPAAHSASYTIKSEREYLGELRFERHAPFAEAELAVIEALVGAVFYPLRNALKYRDALAQSYTDPLTGLLNRLSLNSFANREIKLAQRHNKALSLLIIDIDHFKHINDQYGHLAGDKVLKMVARKLKNSVRETDQVFRYGGEEFLIFLHESDLDSATKSAERIRQNIAKACTRFDKHTLRVKASIGVSSLANGDDFNALFTRADHATYQAKQQGRNRVVTHFEAQTLSA